jgi:hypothetical protein
MDLLNTMSVDHISDEEKLNQLRSELANFFQNPIFHRCKSMGQLVKQQLKQTLQKNLALIKKNLGKFED